MLVLCFFPLVSCARTIQTVIWHRSFGLLLAMSQQEYREITSLKRGWWCLSMQSQGATPQLMGSLQPLFWKLGLSYLYTWCPDSPEDTDVSQVHLLCKRVAQCYGAPGAPGHSIGNHSRFWIHPQPGRAAFPREQAQV